MTKYLKTKAIVLHRVNYGEADRIITFLTENEQLSAIAKGVRRAKSKLAGSLEPLNLIELSLVEAGGSLYRITGASIVQPYDKIITSYEKLTVAYQIMKKVKIASFGLIGNEGFHLLQTTFFYLNRVTNNLALIEAWFNFQLAKILGEELNLTFSDSGQKITLNNKYEYNDHTKGFFESDNGKIFDNSLRLLKLLSQAELSLVLRIKETDQYAELILDISERFLAMKKAH